MKTKTRSHLEGVQQAPYTPVYLLRRRQMLYYQWVTRAAHTHAAPLSNAVLASPCPLEGLASKKLLGKHSRVSRAAPSSALSWRTPLYQTTYVFHRGTLKASVWYPVIQVGVFLPSLTCVNHKVKGMEYSGRLRSSYMAHMARVWNLESLLLVMERRVCKGGDKRATPGWIISVQLSWLCPSNRAISSPTDGMPSTKTRVHFKGFTSKAFGIEL